jgi:hypothetical protein
MPVDVVTQIEIDSPRAEVSTQAVNPDNATSRCHRRCSSGERHTD